MNTLSRWTGLSTLLEFGRYFAFNLPRTTTFAGLALLVGVAVASCWMWVRDQASPVYLIVYGVVVAVAAIIASAGIVSGRAALTSAAWAWGSVVAVVSIAGYVASRLIALPGLVNEVGRWDYPLGTFSIALAATFLLLHLSVSTGVNVAWPDQRRWHD